LEAHHWAWPPLLAAVALKKPAFVQLLLAHGADPNVLARKDAGFWSGYWVCPLSCAMVTGGRGCLDMMRLLLEWGADPNQVSGST